MGFFSNLEKKNVVGPTKASFVFKVEHTPNPALRKFTYVSVAGTDNLLDNFFDGSLPSGYLTKYKEYLNPSSVHRVFKLLALDDLRSVVEFEKMRESMAPDMPSLLDIPDKEQFEKDVQFVFDCTDDDVALYQRMTQAGNTMLAADFMRDVYGFFIARGLGVDTPPEQAEMDTGARLLSQRWEIFRALIKKSVTA